MLATHPTSREALERLLVDESPQALVVLSPEGEVLFWNRMCEHIFGYAQAEALGRELAALVVPPNRVDEDRMARQQALDADVHIGAATRRHKDGRLLYVDVTTHAVRNGVGDLHTWVISMRDVTAQRVERDARWIDQRYRNLLESVPDAIVIVNDSGRIVLFNSQAERLFVCRRDDMIGSSIEKLLPTRYRHAHIGHRTRYHGAPQMRSMGAGLELYGLRGDGTEFPVEISLSPLDTEEGQFVMSAIRDITERKCFSASCRARTPPSRRPTMPRIDSSPPSATSCARRSTASSASPASCSCAWVASSRPSRSGS
jgi:protein-histidine pros-kinase